MKRTGIKRKRTDAKLAEAYHLARVVVFNRAGERCENCLRRFDLASMHAHHRLPRQPRRDDRPCNLLGLCLSCHNGCHAQPVAAKEMGWIIGRWDRRGPEEIPVHLGRWICLLDVAGKANVIGTLAPVHPFT